VSLLDVYLSNIHNCVILLLNLGIVRYHSGKSTFLAETQFKTGEIVVFDVAIIIKSLSDVRSQFEQNYCLYSQHATKGHNRSPSDQFGSDPGDQGALSPRSHKRIFSEPLAVKKLLLS